MDLQTIFNIQTLISHISDLSFQILDSTESDLTCIDGGLRTHFNNGAQMYEDLRKVLNRACLDDAILHLQDPFHLHYINFQPGAASAQGRRHFPEDRGYRGTL